MNPAMDPTATGLLLAAASLLSGLAVSWLWVILLGLVDADPEAAPPRAIFERDRQRRLRPRQHSLPLFRPVRSPACRLERIEGSGLMLPG